MLIQHGVLINCLFSLQIIAAAEKTMVWPNTSRSSFISSNSGLEMWMRDKKKSFMLFYFQKQTRKSVAHNLWVFQMRPNHANLAWCVNKLFIFLTDHSCHGKDNGLAKY